MKKVFALLSIAGLLTFANINVAMAQDATPAENTEQVADDQVAQDNAEAVAAEETAVVDTAATELSFHQMLKRNTSKVVPAG